MSVVRSSRCSITASMSRRHFSNSSRSEGHALRFGVNGASSRFAFTELHFWSFGLLDCCANRFPLLGFSCACGSDMTDTWFTRLGKK